MGHIEKMENTELLWEFERIINRICSYSASGEYEYKDEMKAELLRRLNKKEKEGYSMTLQENAKKYLEGEKLREKGRLDSDKSLYSRGSRLIFEAVTDFQKSGESQEILFDEVERLANRT